MIGLDSYEIGGMEKSKGVGTKVTLSDLREAWRGPLSYTSRKQKLN